MTGFIYIWRDRKHDRYYIGSHWGTPDDGYVCSSSWMKDAYEKRPLDFKRRILAKIETSRSDLYLEEQRWLNMIKPDEVSKRYYNVCLSVKNHWHQYDDKRSSISEKMSKTRRGRKLSPEHTEKIRLSRIGMKHSKEAKASMSRAWRTRPPMSEDTKEKIGSFWKGRKRSDEDRKKKSDAAKRRYGSL